MVINRRYYNLLLLLILAVLLLQCKDAAPKVKKNKIVPVAVSKEEPMNEIIRKLINNAAADTILTDSSLLFQIAINDFYAGNEHQLCWSNGKKWNPLADSLLYFIKNAKREGLYPSDYHFAALKKIKANATDSLIAANKIYWAKGDLLFTNAAFHIFSDLKQGRLQPDSLSWRNSARRSKTFFVPMLKKLFDSAYITSIFNSVEPVYLAYHDLKKGIPEFISRMDTNSYTYIKFPFKSASINDSLRFVKSLQKRLSESKMMSLSGELPDSASLADAIKKYQSSKKLAADGKFGPSLINSLNSNDLEKFKRIAINLDRYKQLPDSLPSKHIFVNIPEYRMRIWENDSLVLESKVICGKPTTPTPLLYGEISDIVIYPTWTVPNSIITKEMLPGLKKNSTYLTKKGLKLLDDKGDVVDASSISWKKYSKGIPYKIQQPSGDNNALGVIKFNFNNPFDVYLHDTNQRYLFQNSMRALSHGCVRVQEWKGFADYLVRNDSLNFPQPDSLKYNSDSITNWIMNKEKHRVYLKYKIPLYIRYFSCAGKEEKIIFYTDIYNSDKALAEKYFTQKRFDLN